MLSKNIAYYIDSHNGIFTFSVSVLSGDKFNYLLSEIIKDIKVKEVKLNYNPDNDNIENIKDTLLYLDYDTLKYAKEFYLDNLANICNKNNNVLLIKRTSYIELASNTYTIKPTLLLHISNIAFSVHKDVIKMIKNRYDTLDIVNHNIVAYMRDKKINQILED